MATAAATQRRAMSALNTIELMLNDLQDVAAEWDRLGDEERTAWSIDWSNEMSALERLGQQAAEGVLADEQVRRYDHIIRRLNDVCALIKRLGLYQPTGGPCSPPSSQ